MDISTLAVALGYTKKQVEEAKREGFRVQIEQDRSILETTGEEKIFYFLPKNPQKTKDGYDEFVYTNNDWEQVGVTDVDLSSYGAALSIENGILSLLNANGDVLNSVDVSGRDYNALQNRPVVTGRDVSTGVNTVLEGYLNFSSDGFTVQTYQDPDKEIDIELSKNVPICKTGSNDWAGRYDFDEITNVFARSGVFKVSPERALNVPTALEGITREVFYVVHLATMADNVSIIRYAIGYDNYALRVFMQTATLHRNNAFSYDVDYQSDWQEIGVKVSSAAVNQNGTITLTMSDGSTVTTTGEKLVMANEQISMGVDENGKLYFEFEDGE